MEKETIYLAKVIAPSKKIKREEFAVHYCYTPAPGNGGGRQHFNYSLSREGLLGYLEGVTSKPVYAPIVQDIINGIPNDVRQGTHPSIKMDRFSSAEFASVIEDAGLTNVVKSLQIKVFI